MRAAAPLLLLLLLAQDAVAADYAVVVASDSPIEALDLGKIRDVFLKRRNFEGEVRLVPVNLLGEAPARIEFESLVLQMEREELNRYWISSHFQGISPPTTQASLASVKRFVERVNGAVGYLPVDMVDSTVKVIHEF